MEIEKYVKKYGEQYRRLVEDSLTFLKEKEPQWGVELNIPKYMVEIMSRVE